MSKNATPRWPIFIWLMQLVPSFTLLGVGFARAQSSGVALDPMKTKLAIGLGVVWTATALGFALRPATRHWLIDRRRQWLTAAASAFLATVMVDIGLTVTGTVPTITEQQNRSVSYALGWFTRLRMTTQDVARDDGRLLHINRRGFRGQEIDVERRLGRKRVVVLGGSQVFDLIGNWPYQVQGLLLGEGINAEVINAGVSGHDTTDSLGKFLTDLWTLKPELVVLCQTWNDTKYISQISAESPYRGLAPVEPVPWRPDWRIYPTGLDEAFSASALYRHIRWGLVSLLYPPEGFQDMLIPNQTAVAPQKDSMGLQQFRMNVELIAELADAIEAELVLCKQARLATRGGTGDQQDAARRYGVRNTGLSHAVLSAIYDACHEIVEDVAETRGFTVVDMDVSMSGRGEYFDDGIHFSPLGSAVAAELVSVALAPLLRE